MGPMYEIEKLDGNTILSVMDESTSWETKYYALSSSGEDRLQELIEEFIKEEAASGKNVEIQITAKGE